MNLLIFTFGTRGDVQPHVALGAALRARGHGVTICTGQGFDAMIEAHGLQSAPATIDYRDLIQTPEAQAALRTLRGKLKAFSAFKGLIHQQLGDMWRIAQDVRPDAIVYHPKAPTALDIADMLGVVAIPTTLQPLFAPTGDFPSPVFPFRDLGRTGNLLTHRLLNWITARAHGSMLAAWRNENSKGAGKRRGFFFDGYDPHGRTVPRLHGYSRHLVARPGDWSAREHITGYWFLDPVADWQPPEALARFLEAGPPPVYVGFGSMPAKDAAEQTGIVVEALRRSGHRGLLATGWGGLTEVERDETVHIIDTAPHDWLFARCAAVVHHGGAGTTHEALRWGRPSIVCPLTADQPFWGRRVCALGAGPPPIPQKRLSVDNLTAALNAIRDRAIIARAGAIGEALRSEGGAAEAAAVICDFPIKGDR